MPEAKRWRLGSHFPCIPQFLAGAGPTISGTSPIFNDEKAAPDPVPS